MSSYPMNIARVSLDHQGGTKSYYATMVVGSSGNSLLIKRWGKILTFGEIKVEQYSSQAAAEKAYDKIVTEKRRKGYRDSKSNPVTEVAGLDDLMQAVGRPTWAKLSSADIRHLDGLAPIGGIREPDPNRFDEDGKWLGDPEPRKVVITEEMREQDRLEKMAEMQAKNPLWGSF